MKGAVLLPYGERGQDWKYAILKITKYVKKVLKKEDTPVHSDSIYFWVGVLS